MLKRLMIIAVSLMSLGVLANPAPVLAIPGSFGTDLFVSRPGLDCSGATANSAVCAEHNTHTNPLTGKDGLLSKITNIISYIAGAAAVIVMIVGALRFVTSGSDISTGARTDNDVENAKRTIANAFIGLVVIVLARTIMLFVLKKL